MDHDIVISGGGMVGASLACALAGLPVRVALVEATPFDSAGQPSFDDRATALSRSSQKILASLGLWSELSAGVCPIRKIHVSERGRFGTAVISGAEQGVGDLGYVIANRMLGAALWNRIESASNINVFCPGTLKEPLAVGADISLELTVGSSSRRISAQLLVVADGARSGLREALRIPSSERSYDQTAIVGNVELAQASSDFMAYEQFTPEGPVALLPFHDGRFIFVMARQTAAAELALALDDAPFLDLLQRGFGRRLGRFTRLGRRGAYPLALTQARRVIAPRAAVIGNAAHGLHPVAGQGYNLGLRDAATLAEVVADAVRERTDPGSPPVLARFQAWRKRDQRNVVAFTDGLVRLFGLPSAAVGRARGAGLILFDLAPGAKRILARHTMGMSGTLTRLARGLPL